MDEYIITPALYKRPGERVPEWVCTCPNRKKWQRHRFEWECLTPEQIAEWRQATGATATKAARELAWIWREFGQREDLVGYR